jgi:hypothetical protein
MTTLNAKLPSLFCNEEALLDAFVESIEAAQKSASKILELLGSFTEAYAKYAETLAQNNPVANAIPLPTQSCANSISSADNGMIPDQPISDSGSHMGNDTRMAAKSKRALQVARFSVPYVPPLDQPVPAPPSCPASTSAGTPSVCRYSPILPFNTYKSAYSDFPCTVNSLMNDGFLSFSSILSDVLHGQSPITVHFA